MKKAKVMQKLEEKGESGILLVVILLVNLGNYLINLFLGRFLGPELFAEVSMLATGMLILSFIALGFQMTAAKYVAAWSAENATRKLLQFGKWFSQRSLMLGSILALIIWLASSPIRSFLNFQSGLSIQILAACIPIYLLMSTGRGILQGKMQFRKLALSYLVEMLARLVLTLPLVYGLVKYEIAGIAEAVALGFGFSFLAALVVSQVSLDLKWQRLSPAMRRVVWSFLAMVGSYELSQILISYSDIVLVKHFFSNQEAGLYAALSLIGRVVYFATWSLVTLLFPKVVQREKQGLPHQNLFLRSLFIVLVLGLVISLGCFLFSDSLISLLFGEAFAGISHLLGYYALATTLFAGANVFVYYYLSLNQYRPVFISIAAGLLQILLIGSFHQSLLQIILVQLFLMGGLFTCMLLFHFFKNVRHEKNKTFHRFALSS